jgi:hypothetical protein
VKSLGSALAGVAALIGLTLTATACDTSPFAAKVGSHVIHQTALNAELRAWAGNSAYVSSFDSANSTSGITVAGDATGTYNTTWVAGVLNGMIDATVVDQHLATTDQFASDASKAASRSVNEISQVGWSSFSPAFRDVLVERLADQATITPAAVPRSSLLSAYNQYKKYFFLQICTVATSTFSAGQAATVAADGVPNGVPSCYTQAQLETQSAAFQNAVLGLGVGKVAPPIKTGYGYQVVKVVSRSNQAFTADLQRVLSLAIVAAQGGSDPVLGGLLGKASVQVNPAYGTWRSSQVMPPSPPSTGS